MNQYSTETEATLTQSTERRERDCHGNQRKREEEDDVDKSCTRVAESTDESTDLQASRQTLSLSLPRRRQCAQTVTLTLCHSRGS